MKATKTAHGAAKAAVVPTQPAVVIRARLPRNYTWAPTADGRPGYVIR